MQIAEQFNSMAIALIQLAHCS